MGVPKTLSALYPDGPIPRSMAHLIHHPGPQPASRCGTLRELGPAQAHTSSPRPCSDHTLLIPAFVKREDPPDVFCPAEMKSVLDAFVHANTMLNLGGLITAEEAARSNVRDTHITHALRPGDTVPLRRLKNIHATAFACDHTVPCLGYGLQHDNAKAHSAEYASLGGQELRALRQQGVEITAAQSTGYLPFLATRVRKPRSWSGVAPERHTCQSSPSAASCTRSTVSRPSRPSAHYGRTWSPWSENGRGRHSS